jgi:hypothetical protein
MCPNRRRGRARPECIDKLSIDQQHKIWDHAIWNGGCPRSLNDALNDTSEIDEPVMPLCFKDPLNASVKLDDAATHEGALTNESQSEVLAAPLVVEGLAPKDSPTEATVTSTDKAAFIV